MYRCVLYKDSLWVTMAVGPSEKGEVRWYELDVSQQFRSNFGQTNFSLITQNVDGLHLISGIKPDLLAELHGNSNFMVCLSCNKKMTYEEADWDKNFSKLEKTYNQLLKVQ